ncbi:MAG TPA: tetratricopeptide repeat protein [Gammaproteobacteria bacterium]|nr:tetratricopeptide repeat protein [Gammaproteobacteria bacterium]
MKHTTMEDWKSRVVRLELSLQKDTHDGRVLTELRELFACERYGRVMDPARALECLKKFLDADKSYVTDIITLAYHCGIDQKNTSLLVFSHECSGMLDEPNFPLELNIVQNLARQYSVEKNYRLSAYYWGYAYQLSQDDSIKNELTLQSIYAAADRLCGSVISADQCSIVIEFGDYFASIGNYDRAKRCYDTVLRCAAHKPGAQHWNALSHERLRAIAEDQLISSQNFTCVSTLESCREKLKEARKAAIEELAHTSVLEDQKKLSVFFRNNILYPLCEETKKELGTPPCHFNVMVMGSLAQNRACLYSDVEFAIGYQKYDEVNSEEGLISSPVRGYEGQLKQTVDRKKISESRENQVLSYLRDFVMLLELKVIALGETNQLHIPGHLSEPLKGSVALIEKRMKRGLQFDESANTPFGQDENDKRFLFDSEKPLPDNIFCVAMEGVVVSNIMALEFLYGDDGSNTLCQTLIEKIQRQINTPDTRQRVREKFIDLSIRMGKDHEKDKVFVHIKNRLLWTPVWISRALQLDVSQIAHPHFQVLLDLIIQFLGACRMRAHAFYQSENDYIYFSERDDVFSLKQFPEANCLRLIMDEVHPFLIEMVQTRKYSSRECGAASAQWVLTFIRHLAQDFLNPVIQKMMEIPDAWGYRIKERAFNEKLMHDLMRLGGDVLEADNFPWVVTVDHAEGQSCMLDPVVARKIIRADTGHLKHLVKEKISQKVYAHRNVAYTDDKGVQLHLKEHCDFPMMPYASYLLNMRLIGYGVPPNRLVIFTVKNKRTGEWFDYPVLVSQTVVEGRALSTYDPKRIMSRLFYEFFVVDVLKHHCDGYDRNYLLNLLGGLDCVDNEQIFARGFSEEGYFPGQKLREINAVYRLAFPEDRDRKWLETFAELDVDKILSAWLDDLQSMQDHYLRLLGKRRTVFEARDPLNPFVSTMVFAEGVVGKLSLDLRVVKMLCREALSKNTVLKPREILERCSGARVAECYFDRPNNGLFVQVTASSSQFECYFLGKKKKFKDMISKDCIAAARIELRSYSLGFPEEDTKGKVSQYFPGESMVTRLDYSEVESAETQDEELDRFIDSQFSFSQLFIKNCKVLDDAKLEKILNNSKDTLTVLSIANHPRLTENSLIYLADNFPHLVILVASGIGAVSVTKSFSRLLRFRSLQVLYLNRCAQLEAAHMWAENLEYLEMETNGVLTVVRLELPVRLVSASFVGSRRLSALDLGKQKLPHLENLTVDHDDHLTKANWRRIYDQAPVVKEKRVAQRIEALNKELEDQDKRVEAQAEESQRKVKFEAEKVLKKLRELHFINVDIYVEHLRHENPEVRKGVVAELEKLGKLDSLEVVRAYVKNLNYKYDEVSAEAVVALMSLCRSGKRCLISHAVKIAEPRLVLKIVLIGTSGAGLSSLKERFINNEFSLNISVTKTVDIDKKTIEIMGSNCELNIWDMPGLLRERYGNNSVHNTGADGFVFVFDLTREHTFRSVESYLEEMRGYSSEYEPAILVGTKSDSFDPRAVESSKAEALAKKFGISYIEVSALSGRNIQEVFETLTTEIGMKKILTNSVAYEVNVNASISEDLLVSQKDLVRVASSVRQVSSDSIGSDSKRVAEFNAQGLEKFKQKNYEGALEDFKNATKLDSNNPIYFSNCGCAEYELKCYEAAIRSYTRAIELEPNNAGYFNRRGLAKYWLKDYEGELEDYRNAAKLESNNPVYFFDCGYAEYELKRYEAAIRSYTRAIELDPNNAGYFNRRGLAKSFLKDYEGKLEDYRNAARLDSNDPVYFSNCGNAEQELKRYEAAIESYTRAIELDPNNAGYFNRRGMAKHWLKDYEGALEDYRNAAKLDSTNANYFFHCGKVAHALNRYGEAILSFDEAIKLDSQNASYFHWRGWAKYYLGDHERALVDLKDAAKLGNTNPEYVYDCAALEYALRLYEAAIKNFDKAIELDSKNPIFLVERALVLKKLSKVDAFLQDLKTLLLINPNHAYANYGLGRAAEKNFFVLPDGESVEVFYRRASGSYCERVSKDSTDIAALYRLGVMHQFGRGVDVNIGKAIEYYQACIKLNNDRRFCDKASRRLAGLEAKRAVLIVTPESPRIPGDAQLAVKFDGGVIYSSPRELSPVIQSKDQAQPDSCSPNK